MEDNTKKQQEMSAKYNKIKEKFKDKQHKVDELKFQLEKYKQVALEKGLKYVVRFEKDNIKLQRQPIKRLLKGENTLKISLRAIDFIIDFIFDLFQFKIGPFIEKEMKMEGRKTIKSRDIELIFKQLKFEYDENVDLKGIPSIQTKRILKILKSNVSESANKYFNYLMNRIIIEIGKSGFKDLQTSEDKILMPEHLKRKCYEILEAIKIDETSVKTSLKQRKLGDFF
ncbi:MAG: hypothetical protein ACTSVE_08425 [Candidatus Helarchaeota archaeon]